MPFIGRECEKQKIIKLAANDNFELLFIYGKRRIGKTETIKESLKNIEGKIIYFCAIKNNPNLNLSSFCQCVFASFDELKEMQTTWNFDEIFKTLCKFSKNYKISLIIDEFPYLCEDFPYLESLLQKFIDSEFMHTNIFMLLCGSSLHFMENLINNEKSPMYRRKTSQMKIEELNYLDSLKFFPKYSTNLEKLNAYMTVGGIPYYLTVLSKYDSLKEGIINEFFNKDGTFFNEPTSFMNSEFDKPTLYNEIIRLIATGFCTYSDINSILNFGGGINPYINKLIELNIVAKKEPIAFTPKKKTIYEIVDTMFKFWFRFIPKNLSAIQIGLGKELFNELERDITSFYGRKFEDVCIQYISLNFNKYQCFKIGRWWGNNKVLKSEQEIDILGLDFKEENLIACECKYENDKISLEILEKLFVKCEIFSNVKSIKYILFSKSGFENDLLEYVNKKTNIQLIQIDEIINSKT